MGIPVLLLPLAALAALTAPPADEHRIDGFEDGTRPPLFEPASGPAPTRVGEHATEGRMALRISSTSYITSWRFPRDWSGFDSIEIDAFNDTGGPVAVSLLVADQPWQDKGRTYWNRHNGGMNLLPGARTLSIPVEGLYRGEAGSRNNDIKANIDPRTIVRVDLGFNGAPGSVYIDHVRLVRRRIPNDFHAFDFGPPSQTVWPGFTPVTWDTVRQDAAPYGLTERQPGSGNARDDTFPTRLFSDWLWISQGSFQVALPRGRWRGWAVFNDCGYWGGEQAEHRSRRITVDGGIVWREDRTNLPGEQHSLYLFENIEPKPGQDPAAPWYDTLFAPKEFTFETIGDPAKFGFVADALMSAKLAALIVIPADASTLWVSGVFSANRDEYRSRAVEDRAAPDRQTSAALTTGSLSLAAPRGGTVSFEMFFGSNAPIPTVRNSAGNIPLTAVTIMSVRDLVKRGYNSLGWSVRPAWLDDADQGRSGRYRVAVQVPVDAAAGAHQVRLDSGRHALDVRINVVPVILDEPDFPIALYGMNPELLPFLREYGFTGLSGGPEVEFVGWDDKKNPVLDFAAADAYFAEALKLGYRGPVIAYGGPGNLAGLRYESVEEQFAEWGRPVKLSPAESARRILNAWRDHAKTAKWPEIYWPMADEPRVRDQTDRIISSVRFLNQVAPWLKLSGSYSIDWSKDDPLRHQRLFAALDASWLNEHDDRDFKEAKSLNRVIGIYNQGRDRRRFGVNLFAERRRGVAAFCQWHASAIHGYQFFDLDGREPDDALVMRTSRGLRPTVELEDIREGITDLRWLLTLQRLAAEAKKSKRNPQEVQMAAELLDSLSPGDKTVDPAAIRTRAAALVGALIR